MIIKGLMAQAMARRLFTSVACLCSIAGVAQAQEARPSEGFSGFVSALVGVAEVESQFQTDDDNRVTTSLFSSGDSATVPAFAVPFELAYMVTDWNTQFFVGIPGENLREGSFFQWEIGARYWLQDNTRLALSFLPPSLLPLKPGRTRSWSIRPGRRRTSIRLASSSGPITSLARALVCAMST
jgi:hypothetical protein